MQQIPIISKGDVKKIVKEAIEKQSKQTAKLINYLNSKNYKLEERIRCLEE